MNFLLSRINKKFLHIKTTYSTEQMVFNCTWQSEASTKNLPWHLPREVFFMKWS